MRTSLIGAALLLLTLSLAEPAHTVSAGASPGLPFGAGQTQSPVFDLRFSAAAAGVSGVLAPCRPADVEAITVQVRFELSGMSVQMWLGEAAARPPVAAEQPVPLRGDNNSFRFENASVTLTAGVSLTLTRGRLTFDGAAGGGAADRFRLDEVTGMLQVITGDVISSCAIAAIGSGALDRTPPSAAFAFRCQGRMSDEMLPCLLLADTAIVIRFSEPVRVADLAALIRATAADGASIPLRPVAVEPEFSAAVRRTGPWPLGGAATVTVGPGLHDRNGNTSTSTFTETFPVVADPGSLDDAGFEDGDARGYTVQTLLDYIQLAPGFGDEARLLAIPSHRLPPPLAVVESEASVLPTEGAYMARVGRLDRSPQGLNCTAGEVSLTARFTLPEAVSHVALEYQYLALESFVRGADRFARENSPLLSGSARAGERLLTARLERPTIEAMAALGDGVLTTGWQVFMLPVGGLEGEEIVLTLRLRPEVTLGLPPLCLPGVLLLDNVHLLRLEDAQTPSGAQP